MLSRSKSMAFRWWGSAKIRLMYYWGVLVRDTWLRIKDSRLVCNPVVSMVGRVSKEMADDDATHLAAGVAYYAIFSLFPLLLGLLAISGQVLASDSTQQSFLRYVTDNLPGSEGLVQDRVSEVVHFRGVLGIGAIIGLLWSASAVFGAINRSVNRAWDVHKDRPFYIAKPFQIGMALLVGVIFLVSTSATSAIEVLADPDRNMGIPGQGLLQSVGLTHLVVRILPCGLNFLLFLLVYKVVPNCKTYWRYVWPGAVLAALLFELAKGLFIWYLDNVASFQEVYGSLTSVMVLLFWIYLSSLILILGAEFSSEYGRMRTGVGRGKLIHPE